MIETPLREERGAYICGQGKMATFTFQYLSIDNLGCKVEVLQKQEENGINWIFTRANYYYKCWLDLTEEYEYNSLAYFRNTDQGVEITAFNQL